MQRHVREHFRFEACDGYMSPIRKREPHLDREIGQLLWEHRDLVQTLVVRFTNNAQFSNRDLLN